MMFKLEDQVNRQLSLFDYYEYAYQAECYIAAAMVCLLNNPDYGAVCHFNRDHQFEALDAVSKINNDVACGRRASKEDRDSAYKLGIRSFLKTFGEAQTNRYTWDGPDGYGRQSQAIKAVIWAAHSTTQLQSMYAHLEECARLAHIPFPECPWTISNFEDVYKLPRDRDPYWALEKNRLGL